MLVKKQEYVILVCVALIAFSGWADVPNTVNIHGQLVDSGGTPLTGERVYSVQFYDDGTAGAPLGGVITGTTTLSGEGLFNIPVQLPAETLDSPEVWYELAIDTDSPADGSVADDTFPERFRVHSVPFTQQAGEALHVDAANIGNGDVDNSELSLLDGVTANIQTQIDTHTGDTNNPHSVTAAQVGLDQVDNTADADKPISTATQNELDLKADAAAVQTALDAKAAILHTHLFSDLTDTATDAQIPDDITLENISVDDHVLLGIGVNTSGPASIPGCGIALGSYANSYSIDSDEAGIAIGPKSTARYPRPGTSTSPWDSPSSLSSIAIGGLADGDYGGIAIGHQANGQYHNIAIGHKASGYSGYSRTAIGNDIVNRYNESCVIRGNLFLDGAPQRTINGQTGRIFYRDTAPDLEANPNGSSDGWVAKAFTIDHPLDPENKVLRHYCLEGPDVWNVYAGNAHVANGQVTVSLPDYYAALNEVGSEIYSLTAVGGFADVCVLEPSDGASFVIGATEDIQVSWSIKVHRNDDALLEDLQRRPVEQLKIDLAQGQMEAENAVVNTKP